MRVCPQCGARYEDDAGFCPMDGSPLGELRSPSGSAPAGQASPESNIAHGFGAPLGSAYGAIVVEEPLVGTVLGDRYRIDEQIGAGGMGLVYRATHVLIGRTLAVKVLRKRYAEQSDLAQRFAQEARVASSIKHPNVVDIIDYGATPEGSPYYVMEYLAGHSLGRELSSRGALDPRRALAIAVQIARGLAAAHQAGVVHRDLKPDNVFVVPADAGAPEQIKILDFGIARVTARKTRLTAAGAVVGTPEYMSPEQARGDDLDARSDLYALGVVVFELLTGRVPLTGDTTVGTLTKQVFELPPALREIDARFAGCPSIESALARLLAKNRDERPPTALDAAQLLTIAATNDLDPPSERREQAALAGWSQAPSSAAAQDRPRPRRSTVMIGSGSVTTAHASVNVDGPTTGSFAAKREPTPESQVPKRPSVIVAEADPRGHGRHGRILHVAQVTPAPGPQAIAANLARPAATPTPAPPGDPRLGQRSRRSFARRHLPLILLGLGAAIFAALVTIGFVRWLQRREARGANVTSMKVFTQARRYQGGMVDPTHAPMSADLANSPTPARVEVRAFVPREGPRAISKP